VRLKEEDYRKGLHVIKSLAGQYRKQGLTPPEINERIKRHITDILYFQTVYSSLKRVKTVKPSPYYAALKILE